MCRFQDMKKVHEEIGSIIKEYRVKQKMTQMDLAKKLGYDTCQFVSLFERGLSKVPHETIGRLVRLLSLPEKKIAELLVKDYELELLKKLKFGKRQ